MESTESLKVTFDFQGYVLCGVKELKVLGASIQGNIYHRYVGSGYSQ